MKEDCRQVVRGKIAIVQEERFRLVADDGRVLLLTMAENVPLEIVDLQRLHLEGTQVEVEYEGEPNVDSGVAYQIRPTQAVLR
jgi:hypothetical protein